MGTSPWSAETDQQMGLRFFRSWTWRSLLSWLVISAIVASLTTYYFPNAWDTKAHLTITAAISLVLGLVVVFFFNLFRFAAADIIYADNSATEEENRSSQRFAEERSPIQSAWEVSKATTDKYWQAARSQNAMIFGVSLIVSLFGFIVMSVGIIYAIAQQGVGIKAWSGPGGLATVAGMLTQFIGATFLLMYRSTVQQMGQFRIALQRLNDVAIACTVANAIDDSSTEGKALKNEAFKALALAIADSQESSSEPN